MATTSLPAAGWRLLVLTLRRQLFSRQTLVGLGLLLLCGLIVLAWSRQREPSPKKFAEQIIVPLHIAFLMPVLSICYGAAVVGGEREDRTLIYLLMTPLPRPWIYLVKSLAAGLLVTLWAVLDLCVLSLLAGSHGREVLMYFLPATVLGGLAYTTLFLLLGALFRHGTMMSLAYWFFLEVLFGNMPGIIKRVSVAYYVRCMIYDAGAALDLGPRGQVARDLFLAIPGGEAATVLGLGLTGALLVGLLIFTRREYRDLS